jgi:predicted ABC-type transport system involved in lysophospholipase L1 biosynthesis ATPase subunit
MLNKLGKTLVVVTHDPNVAKRAHRTLYLHKGQFEVVA